MQERLDWGGLDRHAKTDVKRRDQEDDQLNDSPTTAEMGGLCQHGTCQQSGQKNNSVIELAGGELQCL